MKLKIIMLLVMFFLTLGFIGCEGDVEKEQKVLVLDDLSDEESVEKEDETVEKKEDIKPMRVHFIDVGFAESAVIETPNSKYILVDTGSKETEEKVISKLEELGIEELETVFVTNKNENNIGGLGGVLDAFTINDIVIPTEGTITDELQAKLIEKEITPTVLESGVSRALDGVVIEVLSSDFKEGDIDSSSIVLRFVYGSEAVLFMSDAGLEVEDNLMKTLPNNLNATVWVQGNHGSEKATGHDFMHYVNPTINIISTDGREGYPVELIYTSLVNHGYNVFRTDLNGDITILLDGKVGVTKEDVILEK